MNNSEKVLLTGGTGKIGFQLIKYLLQKDYTVIFTSRSSDSIQNTLDKLNDFYLNKRLYGIETDLEKDNSIKKIINYLYNYKLWPDSLVNNARNIEYTKVMTRENWIGEYLLDVVIPYELSMALSSHADSKLKSIINISSIYGIVPPNPNLYNNPEKESPINYSVAKAALIHLTKELAIRLATKKIRVNSISYGGVEGRVTEEFKQKYSKLCPMGRMLTEEEVTGAVFFLISDMSVGITGHNLVVDGGWSVW